jgi:adenine-specific DNA-methyltransferase
MEKTLETLTELLKKDQRLTVDSNLAKNKIIELALQLDKDLLKILLSSPEIKQIFFQEAEGILVFDKIKFQSFISNKQFLPDSFTKYKNKIGLASDGQYFTDNQEVVLTWPYKDCILEGGQTKEDAKRHEIFWNETLAPDEIDRLLTPKIFTNFQKYDKGEKVSMDNISLNDNLVIKGNNLLSLYSLKEKYQGKIKLIYIDPPYNPDSKSNTFVYNNGFNESTWLTFMKNRLEVAKKLLTLDGCLIVAIDKNEQAELTVLLKELFRGYEIHVITIVHNPEGTQAVGFSYTHEYAIFVIPSSKLINKKKVDVEWKGFLYQSFGRDDSVRSANPSCFYPIIVENEKVVGFGEVLDESEHPEKTIIEKDDKLYVWPIDEKGIEGRWRWIRNNVELKKEFLRFNKKTKKIECQKTSETYKTVWMEKSRYDAGRYGSAILKKLVPNNPFSFPKSLWNVYDCLYAVVGNDKNAIILDFFGGSGTTAHAVLELNKQDGGNRKFIICEQMDYIETVTKERIRKVCEIDNKGSFVYCELAEFNQEFINQIQNAKNTSELWKIWDEMKKVAFLSYKLEPKEIDNTKREFTELSFEDQQKFLISLLDKNLLYVPYCDMGDKSYKISEEVKKLNRQFYFKVN